MRLGRWGRDAMFVVGFACVVVAAFLVTVPLGLVVLGGPLMALAVIERRAKNKGSGT